MKRIYIAGPLNAPACSYIENISNMMIWAERIRKMGFAVLTPCLDILMGIKFGTWTYRDYFNNNLAWLEVADAVFLCPGWENSEGCRKEAARARELKIPTYTVIEEINP